MPFAYGGMPNAAGLAAAACRLGIEISVFFEIRSRMPLSRVPSGTTTLLLILAAGSRSRPTAAVPLMCWRIRYQPGWTEAALGSVLAASVQPGWYRMRQH